MISILIPTHNHICIDLVQAIHLQAENSHYPFEIIVADDASTDLQTKKANRLIGEMQGCSYIELNQNIGPARIRNFLVSQAKYSYILLMDADTFPAHPRFLTDYIQSARPDSIICGGFVYERTSTPKMCQLRYKYGIRVEETSAQERNRNPYDKFISMCFLADKAVFEQVKFDENMHFGYEDAQFGIQLERANIPIYHIDNPVYHRTTDEAAAYLQKIEKSIRNLLPQMETLQTHIRLLSFYRKLHKTGLTIPVSLLFHLIRPLLVRNLTGRHPSLHFFAFYKLGYLCEVIRENN